jgi:hypothetical protein
MPIPAPQSTATDPQSAIPGDLLPCPFCGTAATARQYISGKASWWAVGCPSAECVIAPLSVDDLRTLAVRIWNTRA